MADRLDTEADRYLQAGALNVAPPPLPSDPLVTGGTAVEQLLRVLGLAANSDDPRDNAESADLHAQRETWTNDAAESFSGQDAAAAQQMDSVAAQQVPQILSGIGGALTGLLQPFIQLPQQLTQGALQAATSLVGRSSPPDPASAVDASADEPALADPNVGAGDPEIATAAEPAEEITADPTLIAAPLGPAPAASSATHPSASTAAPVASVAAGPSTPAPPAAMTGMPMMPPVMPPGSATESRAETKRVATAPARGGTPVVGRLATVTQGPVVTTRIDGKPMAQRRFRIAESAEESS